jgi:hypothetical protein
MNVNKERYIKMTKEEMLELKNNGYEEWLEEVENNEEEFDYIEYEEYMNTLINMANERSDDEWR